jgi:hypothetical protein
MDRKSCIGELWPSDRIDSILSNPATLVVYPRTEFESISNSVEIPDRESRT